MAPSIGDGDETKGQDPNLSGPSDAHYQVNHTPHLPMSPFDAMSNRGPAQLFNTMDAKC